VCQPHALLVLALASVACGPEIVSAAGDDGTESESGESETGDDELVCPPEPNPMPVACSLPGSCPHWWWDSTGTPNAVAMNCLLEALRDRRIGTYSFYYETGFTGDDYVFQILDDHHVQWTREGWTDTDWCIWGAGVSLLRAPEVYDECLARHPDEAQAQCLWHFAADSVPDSESISCPML
jgi:hypothetical protein